GAVRREARLAGVGATAAKEKEGRAFGVASGAGQINLLSNDSGVVVSFLCRRFTGGDRSPHSFRRGCLAFEFCAARRHHALLWGLSAATLQVRVTSEHALRFRFNSKRYLPRSAVRS